MWINVIDYRGDETIINSRGDSLFSYRTKYFQRQQEDFEYWKQAGHKFRCFTQHDDDNYIGFDDVVKISRGNAAFSRNCVLNYYTKGDWISIWDNDVSLYWDKFNAIKFTLDCENVCKLAEEQNIISFVPFNPLVSPYSKNIPKIWTFNNQIVQNALIFCKILDFRYDENLTTREDYDIGCAMTLAGYKTARLENISLKSMVNGKSTIFTVNAYHEAYKNPGPKANPKGLLKYDAQLDRLEKYKKANEEMEQKYSMSLQQIEIEQRKLWKITKNNFNELFSFN